MITVNEIINKIDNYYDKRRATTRYNANTDYFDDRIIELQDIMDNEELSDYLIEELTEINLIEKNELSDEELIAIELKQD